MVRVHDKHSEVWAIVVVTSVGEDVEKFEPLCTIDRNVKWYSLYGKQYGSSTKLKIELPYMAILLQCINPKEFENIQRDICTHMTIEA